MIILNTKYFILIIEEKKPRIFNGRDKVIAIKRLNDLGNDPISILCPFCEEKVITDVDYNVGGGTWAWCGGIIGLGFSIFRKTYTNV